MKVRILGAAAGGGVPQWNCRCPNCAAARAGSPDVLPRTQSSVAVSGDGRAWFLLNVSPDVRQQLLAYPELGPPEGRPRGSAIVGCVLTDAELDHTAGLLMLREGCDLEITSTMQVRSWLRQYFPVEWILHGFIDGLHFSWAEIGIPMEGSYELMFYDRVLEDFIHSGLWIRFVEVDRHIPRYVAEDTVEAVGSVVGIVVEDARTGGKLVYAPCVASLGEPLVAAAKEADCVLFDGTFWTDNEPIRFGIGKRTARKMGHLPVSGLRGSLRWLADLPASHRVYVHINNTNPMLNQRGPQHRQVEACGVRVGADGDVFEL
jgi:pyrroloquinoline quinone biosynthesis protein B